MHRTHIVLLFLLLILLAVIVYAVLMPNPFFGQFRDENAVKQYLGTKLTIAQSSRVEVEQYMRTHIHDKDEGCDYIPDKLLLVCYMNTEKFAIFGKAVYQIQFLFKDDLLANVAVKRFWIGL
jgi:hypothetical protein